MTAFVPGVPAVDAGHERTGFRPKTGAGVGRLLNRPLQRRIA
ncbi:hypothetical protein SAMN04488074_10495 [Lentzea albidocapillata subsp. violacea]|uniref:Uncharacterized protein n=1 Tax=Lentzea albidocapillata subsp. violacea TaxID=128104 RepID=A0A1G8YMN5_9PSEU|nr:hypothetical protein SAMN04488074_10495 [Lentzea albidocapillata subsp. violacea]